MGLTERVANGKSRGVMSSASSARAVLIIVSNRWIVMRKGNITVGKSIPRVIFCIVIIGEPKRTTIEIAYRGGLRTTPKRFGR
ncbi:MAG: hypothetical protein RSA02_05835 [Bacteroidales bacterium]